jgi:hypothetical protein
MRPTTHDRVCYTILIYGPMTQAALVQSLHNALPVTVRRAVRELTARDELRVTPDGQYELTSREQIALSREIVTSGASSENIADLRPNRPRRVRRLHGARPPSGNTSGRV